MNIVDGNFPAIDLGDLNRKLAIQVTSTASLNKIEYTVQKFVEKELHKTFDRLVILRIGKHVKHRTANVTDENNLYNLEINKDVWDLDWILKTIKDHNSGKIADICEFLQKEIRTDTSSETLQVSTPSSMALPIGLIDKEILRELDLLKKTRFFTGTDIAAKSLNVSHRIISGDLQYGSTEVRELAINWCARLLSTSNRERGAEILKTCLTSTETEAHVIAKAFVNYKIDGAVKSLSQIALFQSPASKSASLFLKSFELSSEETLSWFEKSGYSLEEFDGDGKFKFFQLCFDAQKWDEAWNALSAIKDDDLENSPVLHFAIASLHLLQTVPEHYRPQIVNQVPFYLRNFPIQTNDKDRSSLVTSAMHFDKCEAVARAYGLNNSANIASDFSLWVKLRNPDTADSAIEILKDRLRDGKNALRYANFAFQFGVEIDVISLEQKIDQQTARNGTISPEGAVARFALVFRQESQADALEYILQHRNSMIEFVSPSSIAMIEIELLCQLGRVEDAKVCLGFLKDKGENPELEAISQRLIDSVTSTDQVAIRIEEYEQTQSLDSLNNLTILLEDEKNWAQLSIYSEKLFSEFGTLEALKRRALALHNLGSDDDLLVLLNDNRELVGQSRLLTKVQANALYNLGKVNESWSIVAELIEDGEPSEDLKEMAIHVAITSGNWGWLNTIVEEDWKNRSNRTDVELLQSAQLAHIISSKRAKGFLIESTSKTTSDPNVYLNAYNIATSEGWEDEQCAKDWLPNAIKNSDEDGPIQRMSLEQILSRSPDWEDHRKSILGKLKKSEVPLFVAAQQLNRSLSEMHLVQSLANQKVEDVRNRTIIRAYSPKRNEVVLAAKSIGIDATALFTLGMLNVLEELSKVFDRIVVPHSTLSWLLNERQRVTFHQPSRLKRANEISRLIQLGKLNQFIESVEQEPDLTIEVGRDFAGFLKQADSLNSVSEQHLVVRSSLVYRAGSLMNEEADISRYQEILVTCSDIVNYLASNAFLTEAESGEALSFLKSQNDLGASGNVLNAGATLYLDGVAVSYFQSLNMLEVISDAGFRCYVSRDELNEIEGLLQYEKYSNRALEVIETIRAFLANGIESEKIEIGPRSKSAKSEDLEFLSHPTASIMDIASKVDGVVVDDAFLNQHAHINLDTDLTPVFTSLDVLKHVHSEGHFSELEYRELRTTIRNSGYSAVPISEAELTAHLNKATITDGLVDENAELKAIRSNLLQMQIFGALDMPNDFSYLVTLQRTMRSCIINQWNNGENIDAIKARSSWLLEFTDFRHWAFCYPYEIGSTLASVGLVTNSQAFMSSGLIESDVRKAAYNEWFDEVVLEPLKQTHPDMYKKMLVALEESLIEVSSKSLEELNNEG
jgi:hypothetical protein